MGVRRWCLAWAWGVGGGRWCWAWGVGVGRGRGELELGVGVGVWRQMREVIETLNSVNIKFMDSVFKIATSPAPDFNLLLLDGNYLNWRLNTLKKVKM